MDIERAEEITAACVRTASSRVITGEFVPLPDCSLEDMLVANRIVDEMPREEKSNADGSTTFFVRMKVDPRLVALYYAFERYGSDPIELLAALGFKATAGDE